MEENKSGLYIVAIVGIIAVVALVIMVTGANKQSVVYSGASTDLLTSADTATDAAGQVTQKACYFCSCSTGGHTYGIYGGHSSKGNCGSGETEKCHTVSCDAP